MSGRPSVSCLDTRDVRPKTLLSHQDGPSRLNYGGFQVCRRVVPGESSQGRGLDGSRGLLGP